MPDINIAIVGKDLSGAPPWPNATELIHLPDSTWYVAILEGGMRSGGTSIALRLDLPDGKAVIAETSAALWEGVARAIRGAEDRWRDEAAGHQAFDVPTGTVKVEGVAPEVGGTGEARLVVPTATVRVQGKAPGS